MYNGIGLTTARGSGTNGYIQTNKFFVKAKVGRVAENNSKGFDADQGTAGVTRKPNKDILEHDRKRQIELKLVVLEDKLVDQGYTDAEIAQKLADARRNLEAAADESSSGALVLADKKVSDTQTHQIAARKEKQLETLRAALGIRTSEPEEENADEIDDHKMKDEKHQKREHAFLDRDYGKKKRAEENKISEKEDKIKNSKESKRKKKNESRKRRHVDDSSDSDDSAGNSRAAKKRHRKSRSDDEDSDSDIDKKPNVSKKHKKNSRSARDVSESESESESDSDSDSATSDDSYSSDTDDSARNLKEVDKKRQRARKGSVEENKKLKDVPRHEKSRRDDSDSSTSDDDSRQQSSRKQVEKLKKSHTRRGTDDDDSGSDEGSLKTKQEAKTGKRLDSKDDSDTDNGRKQKYKKPVRRHDSDSDSDSEEGQIKEKQLTGSGTRHDSESVGQQNKSVSGSKSGDRDDMNRQVRRTSPKEDFRSAVDYKRRKEDQYPDKNDNKESGLVRRGRDEVSDERRERTYRKDDEPRYGSKNVDRDYEPHGGDRWRMRSEDDDEDRGGKRGREEDDYKYRSQKRRDEERDNRYNERDMQRDYSKRARYDDSRSSERKRRDDERDEGRARRRD